MISVLIPTLDTLNELTFERWIHYRRPHFKPAEADSSLLPHTPLIHLSSHSRVKQSHIVCFHVFPFYPWGKKTFGSTEIGFSHGVKCRPKENFEPKETEQLRLLHQITRVSIWKWLKRNLSYLTFSLLFISPLSFVANILHENIIN